MRHLIVLTFSIRAKPKEKNAPMSIAPLSNADWRSAAKRKRELFIPARAQQPSTTEETKPEVLQQSSDSFGLQIQQKKTKNIIEDGQAITTETVVTEQQIVTNDPQEIQKTLEQRAIEAILKGIIGIFLAILGQHKTKISIC